MSTRAFSRAGVIGVAIALASCRSEKPAAGASTTSAAPPGSEQTDAAGGPNVVTVTTSDYRFEAPAEIPAGLTVIRLVNKGPSLHHIQLMKLQDGKSLEDLLLAMK